MANNEASNQVSINLQGGAAIIAPAGSFPHGIPHNALVVMPLEQGHPVEKEIFSGPVAIKMEDLWPKIGFNGPPVQVDDDQGRPVWIGVEDLLSAIEKSVTEAPDDLNRARFFAQKLMEFERWEKAETVLARIVARGLDGNDWLALGVAQAAQKKYEKAEKTLNGAQNLLKTVPLPSLHLARVSKEKGDVKAAREFAEKALAIDGNFVDGWVYLASLIKETESEDKAISVIEELANTPAYGKIAAPYIALQGFYAGEEQTREKAIVFAKKAMDRAPGDPLALIVLSALYGQAGKLEDVVKLLAPQESLMMRDVRLAHNYFEALFQLRDLNRITQLLNKLANSQVAEVKQFAMERARAIQQLLQRQQQQLPA